MNIDVDLSTLQARPPWRVVSWLRRISIIVFVVSILMVLVGLGAGFLYYQIPADGESALEGIYSAISETLENAGYYGVSFGFYALILWLIAQGVEGIDRLVWLNADKADRKYIYKQRVKKNAKNK